MLVRVDGEALGLHVESETLALALRARLHCEFDSARNLVGVDDLEAFLGALRVLSSDHSTEPEDLLLHGVQTGTYDSLGVLSWVERGDHSLFLEDLVVVPRVDAWNRALSTELEGNAIGHLTRVLVSDIDADRAVVELSTLRVKRHSDHC
jgi:hypothetical protein